YRSPQDLEGRVRSLALLEPASDFRAQFHYQVVAFGAAGLAAERAASTPWDTLLRERILRPLGMSATTPAEPPPNDALAQGYRRGKDGIIRQMERYSLREADPAGSIHSTARDLGAFLRFNISQGVLGEKIIVSAHRMREIQEP